MDPFSDLYQSKLIHGFSTSENTSKYFTGFSQAKDNQFYTQLDGIKISRIGFGCYRIMRGNPEFGEALELALLNGINLIDTSSNYGDGSSEALVGDILKKLIDSSKLKREEVFLVTKIGYIQGKNMELVESMEKSGAGFTDIVHYDANCFHCISPDFLEDQLERARKRLGLSVIDCVLLHNPEYFLMDRENHNVAFEKANLEYYDRIKKALEFLENKRQMGVIRYYGISSNTFPKEENTYTFTSLEKVWEIAEEIRKNLNVSSSGFRVIQFPGNLYEIGFTTEKNNKKKSIIQFAIEKNLFTLINRPLNAMKKKGGMDRLAMYTGKNLEFSETQLDLFRKKLEDLQNTIFTSLGIEEEFTFLSVIDTYKDKFNNSDHYHQALNYSVIPQLRKLLSRIERLDTKKEFYQTFLNSLNEGIEVLGKYVEAKASARMEPLLKKLEKMDTKFVGKSLSQSAVLTLLSFPGVNSVLVGMRQKNYVKDMLPVLKNELPEISGEDLVQFEI